MAIPIPNNPVAMRICQVWACQGMSTRYEQALNPQAARSTRRLPKAVERCPVVGATTNMASAKGSRSSPDWVTEAPKP